MSTRSNFKKKNELQWSYYGYAKQDGSKKLGHHCGILRTEIAYCITSIQCINCLTVIV